MSIEITKISNIKTKGVNSEIVLLPHDYGKEDSATYSSTAISFYKYSKHKLDISYYSEPEILLEQRSSEWFAPLFLITSTALTHNPQLISILCGVVANYLTDFFKGQSMPQVRLDIMYEETETSKKTKISYQGDIDGLDTLKDSINAIASKGRINE